MLLPPRSIPHPRLFRLLLQRPRASLPLDFRLPGAEHTPLRVQALRAVEYGSVLDNSGDLALVRDARVQCAIVSYALLVGDSRVFDDGDSVARLLDETTMSRLWAAMS